MTGFLFSTLKLSFQYTCQTPCVALTMSDQEEPSAAASPVVVEHSSPLGVPEQQEPLILADSPRSSRDKGKEKEKGEDEEPPRTFEFVKPTHPVRSTTPQRAKVREASAGDKAMNYFTKNITPFAMGVFFAIIVGTTSPLGAMACTRFRLLGHLNGDLRW